MANIIETKCCTSLSVSITREIVNKHKESTSFLITLRMKIPEAESSSE
jgi:hypothetical protein